jgi:hypothetical protein
LKRSEPSNTKQRDKRRTELQQFWDRRDVADEGGAGDTAFRAEKKKTKPPKTKQIKKNTNGRKHYKTRNEIRFQEDTESDKRGTRRENDDPEARPLHTTL